MFSDSARYRLEARGWSLRSFVLFFADSWNESIEGIRSRPAHARAIAGFAAAFGVALCAGLLAVYRAPSPAYLSNVVATLAAAAVLTGWTLLYVHLLRRPEGGPVSSVGLANYLTLVRFYLIAPLVVLLLQGHLRAALVVYVVLGLTDIADGVVARVRDERTRFGVVMDPLADVFSTAAVFAVFTAQGLVPVWLFAILAARYVMLIVGSFIFFLVVGPMEFKATLPGKIVGLLQGGGIVAIVLCGMVGGEVLDRAGPVLFPFLGLSFASIVISQAIIGVRQRRRLRTEHRKVVNTLDLEGNLAVFEPIAVFQMLNIARVTGGLLFDAGHNSAQVFFENGDVTFAEINHRSVKLGEYLVSSGVITQQELDSVLVKKRRGRKIGGLLVEIGVIDEDALRKALEEQVKEVIYEVVRWEKGWFQFRLGKTPTSREIAINIPLDHLMLEGVKRMDEEEDGE